MDLVKNKTNSQSRQFVIILQNQAPSQGVRHMHPFLAVCWVRNIVDIKTDNKYLSDHGYSLRVTGYSAVRPSRKERYVLVCSGKS